MDQTTGTNPACQCPSERNPNQQRNPNLKERVVGIIQKGSDVQLTVDFSIETDRKIRGVAHFEDVDRENEIILIEAIEHALPQFMQHPILHYQHTERPVGTVTKAFIKDKSFNVEASIFETEDTDDVWSEIESGKLNKFSIFGRRDSGSPECKMHPSARFSPCVTKALTLFSISTVGDNAMNQKTFLEVAKADDTGSALIHTTTDGTSKKRNDMEEEDKKKEDQSEVEEKADEAPELLEEPGNRSAMMKSIEEYGTRLSAIEETLKGFTAKAEESDEMEETKEDMEKCSGVKKAEESTTVEPEFITKAALDEITKAYIAKVDSIEKAYTDLKDRVEKMEKQTIEKGGNIIVINKADVEDNARITQLDRTGV